MDTCSLVVEIMTKRLRPKIPIIFEKNRAMAVREWSDFVSRVSAVAEGEYGSEVAEYNMSYAFYTPPILVIPGGHRFAVYVVDRNSIVDAYLGYNFAYVTSSREGVYHYALPYIGSKAAKVLAENGFNPAVLENTIFYIPHISSIPYTSVAKEEILISDYLRLHASALLVSPDKASSMMGYIVFKMLRNPPSGKLARLVSRLIKFAAGVIEKEAGIHVSYSTVRTDYMGFPVEIHTVILDAKG